MKNPETGKKHFNIVTLESIQITLKMTDDCGCLLAYLIKSMYIQQNRMGIGH